MALNFFKKKPEPEKKPVADGNRSVADILLEKCNANTQGILSKLAMKRDELLQMIAAEGKEEDIKEGFEIMADYISSVDWKGIIDQTLKAARLTDENDQWTDRVDLETAKLLINMQWKIIRVDMNEMIGKVVSLVEGDPA